MKTATIGITVYGISRPKYEDHANHYTPREYKAIVGVSNVDSPSHLIRLDGWRLDSDNTPKLNKRVEIALPEDVSYGWWTWGKGQQSLGLYAQTNIHNGAGRAVYAKVNAAPIFDTQENYETAIDAAIQSGITLSIPRSDGKRHNIPVKVIAVSPLSSKITPQELAAWDDAHHSPQTDET